MLGGTPLHCAVWSKNATLAQVLLHLGADTECKAREGLNVHDFVREQQQKGRKG